MKFRQFVLPLIIFLIGFVAITIGGLFKIMHLPYGSEMLIVGTFIKVVAILFAIIILITEYRKQ